MGSKKWIFFFVFLWSAGLFSPQAKADISPDLQEKINRAIQKGREYLYKELKESGLDNSSNYKVSSSKHFPEYPQGVLGLQLYALLKTGVPPSDRLMKRGFARLCSLALKKTYSVSLALLALYAKKECELKEQEASKNHGTVRKKKMHFSPQEKKFMVEAVKWLLKTSIKKGKGGWGYGNMEIPGGMGGGRGRGGVRFMSSSADHSNTQYAVLGLWAAHRMGVKIQSSYWKNILLMYLQNGENTSDSGSPVKWPDPSQIKAESGQKSKSRLKSSGRSKTYNATRGWRYTIHVKEGGTAPRGGRPPRGRGPQGGPMGGGINSMRLNMVIAGVCGVLISGEMTRNLGNKKVQASIGEGLCWIAGNLEKGGDVGMGFGGSMVSINMMSSYFLYSLERLGAFTELERLGQVEWYKKYAPQALKAQQTNGSFSEEMSDTCLVLLFLSRATQQFLRPRIVTGAGRHGR